MKNLSGNPENWFKDTSKVEESKEVINVKELEAIAFPDLSSLDKIISDVEDYYAVKANKRVGELIVSLRMAKSDIQKIKSEENLLIINSN